jgi:hypothetical protein
VALKQHTAHLTEKYEELSANYKQLCQIVMNMASQSRITTNLLLLLLLQLHH